MTLALIAGIVGCAPSIALARPDTATPELETLETVVVVVDRRAADESNDGGQKIEERIDEIARNVITRISGQPVPAGSRRPLVLLAPGGSSAIGPGMDGDGSVITRTIESLANSNWDAAYTELVDAAVAVDPARRIHISKVLATARKKATGDGLIFYIGPGAFPPPRLPESVEAVKDEKGRRERKGALEEARAALSEALGDDVWVFTPLAHTSPEWEGYCTRRPELCQSGEHVTDEEEWVDRAFPAPPPAPEPTPVPPESTVDPAAEAGDAPTSTPEPSTGSAWLLPIALTAGALLLGGLLVVRRRVGAGPRLSGRLTIEDGYSPIDAPVVFETLSLDVGRSYEIAPLPCERGSLVRLRVAPAGDGIVRIFAFYEVNGQEVQRLVTDALSLGADVAHDELRFRYLAESPTA